MGSAKSSDQLIGLLQHEEEGNYVRTVAVYYKSLLLSDLVWNISHLLKTLLWLLIHCEEHCLSLIYRSVAILLPIRILLVFKMRIVLVFNERNHVVFYRLLRHYPVLHTMYLKAESFFEKLTVKLSFLFYFLIRSIVWPCKIVCIAHYPRCTLTGLPAFI